MTDELRRGICHRKKSYFGYTAINVIVIINLFSVFGHDRFSVKSNSAESSRITNFQRAIIIFRMKHTITQITMNYFDKIKYSLQP